MSGTIEKLPSSCVKWQSNGWKKRFIMAKSRGGQGNMAHPDFISWHEKEGKAAAGQLDITPGSTLTVGDLQKGMMIRTFDADQLWLRVPSSTPNAEAEHKAWGEALEALMAQLPPLPYDDGGPIGERLVDK